MCEYLKTLYIRCREIIVYYCGNNYDSKKRSINKNYNK